MTLFFGQSSNSPFYAPYSKEARAVKVTEPKSASAVIAHHASIMTTMLGTLPDMAARNSSSFSVSNGQLFLTVEVPLSAEPLPAGHPDHQSYQIARTALLKDLAELGVKPSMSVDAAKKLAVKSVENLQKMIEGDKTALATMVSAVPSAVQIPRGRRAPSPSTRKNPPPKDVKPKAEPKNVPEKSDNSKPPGKDKDDDKLYYQDREHKLVHYQSVHAYPGELPGPIPAIAPIRLKEDELATHAQLVADFNNELQAVVDKFFDTDRVEITHQPTKPERKKVTKKVRKVRADAGEKLSEEIVRLAEKYGPLSKAFKGDTSTWAVMKNALYMLIYALNNQTDWRLNNKFGGRHKYEPKEKKPKEENKPAEETTPKPAEAAATQTPANDLPNCPHCNNTLVDGTCIICR